MKGGEYMTFGDLFKIMQPETRYRLMDGVLIYSGKARDYLEMGTVDYFKFIARHLKKEVKEIKVVKDTLEIYLD